MTKVYPNTGAAVAATQAQKVVRYSSSSSSSSDEKQAVLTVWKKSLLFNCTGFTVFDAKGNLVFRVDNYMAGNKAEIVLMDAAGKPLLTIRRKRLSLGDNWVVFEGEKAVNPLLCVRKNVNILNGKSLAYVSSSSSSSRDDDNHGSSSSSSSSAWNYKKGGSSRSVIMYEIEGSYAQRSCAVYDQKRRRVAEIKRKESGVGGVALGGDVFRLIVNEPDLLDTATAMALVILLDQMFGSSSSRLRNLAHPHIST